MKKLNLLSFMLMAGLASCAMYENTKTIGKAEKEHVEYHDKMERIAPTLVTRSSGIKVATSTFKIRDHAELPKFFSHHYSLDNGKNTDSFIEYLSRLVHDVNEKEGLTLRFEISPDAEKLVSGAGSSSANKGPVPSPTQTSTPSESAGGTRSLGGIPTAIGPIPTEAAISTNTTVQNLVNGFTGFVFDPKNQLTFNKTGSVEEILNSLTSNTTLYWAWENGKISIFRHKTQTFALDSLPGVPEFSGALSTASGSNKGEISSTSQFKSGIKYTNPDVWKSIEVGIKNQMSEDGKLTLNPTSSSITVTDTPIALANIESYMDTENERLDRSIFFKIDIVDVSDNHSDQFGSSFNDLVFKKANQYGLKLTNGADGLTDNVTRLQGSFISPTSALNGSDVLIKALSEVGKVVQRTTGYVHTTNGVPAPWQEVREIQYLAKKTTNQTQGVGSSTSMEPGITTEGFVAHLTPTITSHGDVLVQMGFDVSIVEKLKKEGTDTDYITVPQRLDKSAMPRVRLRPGESFVAFYLERETAIRNGQGVGNANNIFMGGDHFDSNHKAYTLAIVTAYFQAR